MYNKNKFRVRNTYVRRQRGYRIKTFDPSHVVANTPVYEVKTEEYVPNHSFSDFAISENLKRNIAGRGYSNPTPIQDESIPEILKGNDVVGIANTGTGKTAAFLIPLIDKVVKQKGKCVLVIAPTRELAVQISEELTAFSRNLNIYSAVCIGGVSMHTQIRHLSKNPHFVIGTPGRLIGLSNQRKLHFRNYDTVVLDEVDRMLDMGFIKDVKQIISELPRARQSLFFSATVSDNVMSVMSQFTHQPVRISLKSQDSALNVRQEVMRVNGAGKLHILQELLDKREFERVLVFGRTKRGAEKLARDLSHNGFSVAAIHGNKTQNQRQKALDLFKRGEVRVLIATDVVARGIDVDNITHVINYELPESYEDYLHRIGRTGRAGKSGTAITFVT